MPFSSIEGQETAVATLSRALRTGHAHHAYRLEGPDGVGKEMAAFAFAQAIVCTSSEALGCGACDACRRAVTFSEERPHSPLHPDVRIVERGFYPPEVIGQRNEEAQEISVNQIRSIVLAGAAYSAHEARGRVFIIRRAEEMSIGAANALLKTLEEPRQATYFLLVTSRPDRLLPTIRSRTLPIRFAPLSDALVRRILEKHDVPRDRIEMAVDLAAGSASLALALADEELSEGRDAFVRQIRDAAKAPHLGPAIQLAEGAERDKDTLRSHLRALAAVLAREARQQSRAPSSVIAAEQYAAVERALAQLDRNAQATWVIASLVEAMQARA